MSVDEEYFTKPDTAQEASMSNAANSAEILSTQERTKMESETVDQSASEHHDASGMEVETPMKEYEQPPTPG